MVGTTHIKDTMLMLDVILPFDNLVLFTSFQVYVALWKSYCKTFFQSKIKILNNFVTNFKFFFSVVGAKLIIDISSKEVFIRSQLWPIWLIKAVKYYDIYYWLLCSSLAQPCWCHSAEWTSKSIKICFAREPVRTKILANTGVRKHIFQDFESIISSCSSYLESILFPSETQLLSVFRPFLVLTKFLWLSGNMFVNIIFPSMAKINI